ncbi:MAG: Rieske 2Fe-2S domain-containing protein [Actinomycetota bacterium]|nr:Rieske 2Fe-2S domain-containing protein [Actinomycetota bacterium]
MTSGTAEATTGAAPVEPVVAFWSDDLVLQRNVKRAVADLGMEVRPWEAAREIRPLVLVVDLDREGALDTVARQRAALPQSIIGGHLAQPDRSLWEAGERAGCDFVSNRGAFARQLRQRLDQPGALSGRHRLALCDASDVAGRLGLVKRIPESPLGPVALWNSGGMLSCSGDRCPHAGATLSEGEMADGVVTCPRHGSQFDVSTGERLRGPADVGIEVYDVIEDSGRIWAVWS